MTDHAEPRRVLVTGAAGIFGTWISEAFARDGAHLLLTDTRQAPLRALADRLAAGGQTPDGRRWRPAAVDTHPADLTEPGDVDALASAGARIFGAPDVLVNNAGIYPRHRLTDMPAADFDRIMRINLHAPFQLTQAVARQMIEHRVAGNIVNISSGAAISTQVGGGAYSTSKAALAMLTRAFALELAPYRIRVNAVAPGFAPGSQVSGLTDDYVHAMVGSIPLGRTSGPGDAPAAVLFLCSPEASFITGTTLTVDGGRTAGTYKPSTGDGPGNDRHDRHDSAGAR